MMSIPDDSIRKHLGIDKSSIDPLRVTLTQTNSYTPSPDSFTPNSGGSVSYYKVSVDKPTTLSVPYEAECNDIIEALGMNFAEGNIFKALWRRASARRGVSKGGYDQGKYDAEKILFFAQRLIIMEKGE